MRADSLDFIPARSRVTLLGALLLVVGVALAASVSFDVADSIDQRDEAEHRLAQLNGRLARLRSAASAEKTGAAKGTRRGLAQNEHDNARMAELQNVVRTLAAPWNELFDAFEAAQDDSIVLLTISPEKSGGRVAFTGEAKNYAALTDYLARLDDGGVLTQTQLLAHEIKGNEHYVAFSANARFVR